MVLLILLGGSNCTAGTKEEARENTTVRPDLQIVVTRPGWLPHGALAISRATGLPLGIELLPEDAAADCPMAPGGKLDVSGLSVAEALARLLHCDSRYERRFGTRSVEIRPRTPLGGATFLDAVVPVFDIRDATLQQAIEAVHRSINPDHAEARGGTRPGESGAPPALLSTRLNLRLERTSIATILHAIARAFGGVSWVVDYPGGQVRYASSRITFWSTGERRWGVAVNARATNEGARPR